ncbi:CheY-like receiver protein [Magnetospirillum fulvum MGU-K5]|uniref:CheY-like receiver protein n=1 Tax=Magnetospirillum fulvum MGU-K5 TaxID=1316936 RepID=S9SBA9_MAGFU|nr:CheY-like receiver protein [Magnetospirillum fulvum MGU-K5]
MKVSALGNEIAGPGGPGPGVRLVVVIEDEAIVLAGYQMLFESWGYVVIAAQSADEALGMLEAGSMPPGFILADFRLRDGQTGTEAIERVRQAFGPDIPGVVVTGDTTVTVDRLRLAASEGMPILHKPVNGRQLQELLTRSFKT